MPFWWTEAFPSIKAAKEVYPSRQIEQEGQRNTEVPISPHARYDGKTGHSAHSNNSTAGDWIHQLIFKGEGLVGTSASGKNPSIQG